MYELVIANRNYSSWSMRPWVLMQHLRIGFAERRLTLFSDDFHAVLRTLSPAGRVPVLVDGGTCVWDSLAIVEYLAEAHPGVWPVDRAGRAQARSICAEMHAGFGALRNKLPMNIEARLPDAWPKDDADLQRDIARIVTMWSGLRAANGSRGPFLFGEFCAADAFFAPVVTRLRTYAVPVPPEVEHYMRTVLRLPAVQDWVRGALAERTFLPEDEPYRASPDEGRADWSDVLDALPR